MRTIFYTPAVYDRMCFIAQAGSRKARVTLENNTQCAKLRRGGVQVEKMPVLYSLDLCWRIVWAFLCHRQSFADIATSFNVCERTVRRYVDLFQRTGDVRPCQRRHGPLPLLGEFEQIVLFRLILANPGIYLCEIQEEIMRMFGVYVYDL